MSFANPLGWSVGADRPSSHLLRGSSEAEKSNEARDGTFLIWDIHSCLKMIYSISGSSPVRDPFEDFPCTLIL